MTKIHPLPESLLYPSDVDLYRSIRSLDPESSRQLILLLPPDMDCTTVIPRVCRLASETNSPVLLLSLYKDPMEELTLRRDLVTVSALIRDANILVETKIEKGTNWMEAIKNHYQPGDVILCIAEQPTGIKRRPLSQVLESNLMAPVYILSDLSTKQQSDSYWLSDLMSWAGSIGIIVGVFLLQIQIVSSTKDLVQTTLLILSVIAEIGLIRLWNGLFG